MFIKNARNELNKTCNINNIAAQILLHTVSSTLVFRHNHSHTITSRMLHKGLLTT